MERERLLLRHCEAVIAASGSRRARGACRARRPACALQQPTAQAVAAGLPHGTLRRRGHVPGRVPAAKG